MTASERLADQLRFGTGTAAVIADPSNMFYLTEGYTGEGLVFLSRNRKVIVTDFRYTEQAGNQAPDFEVQMTEKGRSAEQVIAELVQSEGVTCIRTETNYLSVDSFEKLKAAVGEEVSCISLEEAPQKLRQIKTPTEVMTIRKACRITADAFRAILPKIREGMTEKELQIELDFTMLKLGADSLAFDTIVAAGEHGSLPHAIPGNRQIRKGEMITLEWRWASRRRKCAGSTIPCCGPRRCARTPWRPERTASTSTSWPGTTSTPGATRDASATGWGIPWGSISMRNPG